MAGGLLHAYFIRTKSSKGVEIALKSAIRGHTPVLSACRAKREEKEVCARKEEIRRGKELHINLLALIESLRLNIGSRCH